MTHYTPFHYTLYRIQITQAALLLPFFDRLGESTITCGDFSFGLPFGKVGVVKGEIEPSLEGVLVNDVIPGAGRSIGCMFHILFAYSAMVRSVENFPEHAEA